MNRTALAMWQGDYKTGSGSVTVQDGGICEVPFSYQSRFKAETALSPEGMLAGAHAASFAMSFAKHLDSIDVKVERIDTVATVKVEAVSGLETITSVDLELVVHANQSDGPQLSQAAKKAEAGCSISRLINAKVNLRMEIKDATKFSAA